MIPEFDLSAEAEQEVECIVEQMLENDRENEQLRREIADIIDREDPPV